jgi:hypothetical protein
MNNSRLNIGPQQLIINTKLLLITIYSLISVSTIAQIKADSIANQADSISNFETPAPGTFQYNALEVYKPGRNKAFVLETRRNVWVYCKDKKGRIKIKRSQITSVGENSFTIKPYDNDFKEVTIHFYELPYIGFTSAGRIIIATISDVIIVGVVVTVLIFGAIIALLSGSSGHGSGPDFSAVPFVPFRKDIHFQTFDSKGIKKWDIRTINID